MIFVTLVFVDTAITPTDQPVAGGLKHVDVLRED